MLSTTKTALQAIFATDPSITSDARKAALEILQSGRVRDADVSTTDRVLTRSEVAKTLKVNVRTVSGYLKRGLLRGVYFGAQRDRAVGISAASVAALIQNAARREVAV